MGIATSGTKRSSDVPDANGSSRRKQALAVEALVERQCPCPIDFTRSSSGDIIASFLTPQAHFYIRSHGSTPQLADNHCVALDGLVDRPRSFAVAELQTAFPTRTVTATMQCAGNRRAHLQGVKKTSGDPWDVGAIGNASRISRETGIWSVASRIANAGAVAHSCWTVPSSRLSPQTAGSGPSRLPVREGPRRRPWRKSNRLLSPDPLR